MHKCQMTVLDFNIVTIYRDKSRNKLINIFLPLFKIPVFKVDDMHIIILIFFMTFVDSNVSST